MTSTDPGPVPQGRPAEVRALADLLPRFMRTVHALKNQSSIADRDRAALVLLFPLSRLGPLRQSALAELVHADPSTVSRHVAALVEQGLVRRVADEADGRASVLVVTPSGAAVMEAMRRERDAVLERVTAHWHPDERASFTGQLHRFVQDLTVHLPSLSAAAGGTSPSAEKDR